MPATQVPFPQVLARIARQTGLAGEEFLGKKSPAPLVTAVVGLRGDRLEPAHLALAARLPEYRPEILTKALQEKHTLVRTWGAHGAFQVVATADLPQQLAAAGISAPRWQRFLEARSSLAAPARLRLLKRLCPTEISKDGLKDSIPDPSTRLFMLREAAQAGHIVWKGGDGQQAVFAWAEEWLGRQVHPDRDYRVLVGRYLTAFGPVEATDLAGWLGVTIAAARKLMAKHRVVEIQVEGEPLNSFMKPEDLEKLLEVRKAQTRGTVVIPPGDPVLHAYRGRFHPRNKEGADDGLVYTDGRLAAVWNLGRGQVSVQLMESASATRVHKLLSALLERAGIQAEIDLTEPPAQA